MSDHVMLLNSGKTDAYRHLVKFVPGDRVDVITERKYTPLYPHDANLHYVHDIADVTEVLDVARKLDSSSPITAVVSPSERSLPVGGYLRSYFNLPGTGFDVAWGFSSKSVMKSRLRSAGVAVARSLTISDIGRLIECGDDIGWPVVVKPVIGSGSMHTYTIGDREEALSFLEGPEAEWFRDNRYQIIVEEYIAMKGEYHCDAIIRNGRVVFSVLQRYFSPLLECTGTWGGSDHGRHNGRALHCDQRDLSQSHQSPWAQGRCYAYGGLLDRKRLHGGGDILPSGRRRHPRIDPVEIWGRYMGCLHRGIAES